MNKTYDVVVVGGGVIGTSCAYHLVKKGFSVALVEKDDIAKGTSSHCDGVALITDKMPGVDAASGYASINRFKELKDELSYDFELHQRGSLYLCETDEEMEIASKYANDLAAAGQNRRRPLRRSNTHNGGNRLRPPRTVRQSNRQPVHRKAGSERPSGILLQG